MNIFDIYFSERNAKKIFGEAENVAENCEIIGNIICPVCWKP